MMAQSAQRSPRSTSMAWASKVISVPWLCPMMVMVSSGDTRRISLTSMASRVAASTK
ncbi:hypothetical protein D3C85_709340 [compost metagenome]|uniref:Uncharacterized protein n=1 Tax=Pseudomonas fluorescens TaxID=294 RepID=A0A5E7VPN0_PSEFL|nr:hypothetical protein PS938_05633 [Pseudomonas fluorescens]